MIIKKERFILRPITIDDLQGYWECMQDKDIKEQLNSVPSSFEDSKKEVEECIKKTKSKLSEVFTIEVNGFYAGNVKLDCQDWDLNTNKGRVHLWIHPKFRGKGLATEVLKIIVKYAFSERNFVVCYAQCKKSNKEICKVNTKCGFIPLETSVVNGIDKILWEIRK
jgi:RimJ/RimL family protein N-acetyltransferase